MVQMRNIKSNTKPSKRDYFDNPRSNRRLIYGVGINDADYSVAKKKNGQKGCKWNI